MSEYNPELIAVWKEYIAPYGMLTPEDELPLWNAFKAGWNARFKSDLRYEAHGY